MKKTLTAITLPILSAIALAGGSHAEGHGKNMATMHEGMLGAQQAKPTSGAGRAGDPSKVSRTVTVAMDDNMRFSPAQVTVKKGETIRFFVKNSGKMAHEMVIGSIDELKSHAEMMRKMPGMQHAESNMVSLSAGQRGAIVWQFDQPGLVDFACLIPGHLEAQMVGKVIVES